MRSWSSQLRTRNETLLAPIRLRVGWIARLALRPTIPARERFYADTRVRATRQRTLEANGIDCGAGPVFWAEPLRREWWCSPHSHWIVSVPESGAVLYETRPRGRLRGRRAVEGSESGTSRSASLYEC